MYTLVYIHEVGCANDTAIEKSNMFFDLTRLEMSYHPAYAYALSFKSLKENILVDIGSCCMLYNSSYRVRCLHLYSWNRSQKARA